MTHAGGTYVGLMSGTSLDGISAAVARFTPATGDAFGVELLGFHVHEYAPAQRDRLLAAMRDGSARDYCRLAVDFGGWLADAAIAVLAEAGVARTDVRAIGTHGQTLWHEPGHSTWQLDAPAVIAERTGLSVVSDFRVRDVAAGGQGAPLVPIIALRRRTLACAPEYRRHRQRHGRATGRHARECARVRHRTRRRRARCRGASALSHDAL